MKTGTHFTRTKVNGEDFAQTPGGIYTNETVGPKKKKLYFTLIYPSFLPYTHNRVSLFFT